MEKGQVAPRPNIAAPEPENFLSLAMDAMADYHKIHGSYAAEWHQLDITFAAGPYRLGDTGTTPTPEHGASWTPKDCEYRYVIESATANGYRILAVSSADKVDYEATQAQKEPRRLTPRRESERSLPHQK
ncbi:MAG: hypothetical protein LJE70_04310 [Chromatiaceae bacterium]|nr:hypothetical protein [Chromatiaceae bacterium]